MDDLIIMYSTNCPKCKILCKKLEQHNVKYQTITDVSIMSKKGLTMVPALELPDGTILDFKAAVDYLNNLPA